MEYKTQSLYFITYYNTKGASTILKKTLILIESPVNIDQLQTRIM